MKGLIKSSSVEPIIWVVGLGTCLGFASQRCAFWIVGALVQTGTLDVAQAALMPTVEYLTIGIVMLSLTSRVHRLPHKRLVAVGNAVVLTVGTRTFLHSVSSNGLRRSLLKRGEYSPVPMPPTGMEIRGSAALV